MFTPPNQKKKNSFSDQRVSIQTPPFFFAKASHFTQKEMRKQLFPDISTLVSISGFTFPKSLKKKGQASVPSIGAI